MDYNNPRRISYVTIKPLQFLHGLLWNDLTKNYIVALRPSSVRECWDLCKLDASPWRVTVWLEGENDHPIIRSIEQEVVVGIEGCDHGYDLSTKIAAMIKK